MTARPLSTDAILREHGAYVADAVRVEAFARALQIVVRPGDVVLDLGCGTGILGLLACRAGAARVYAVDDSGLVEVARAIASANGCSDRIVHIRGKSTEIDLPERADIVVCDEIGPMGFEARIIEYFADARKRLLTPDARLIPSRVALHVAPLNDAGSFSGVDEWEVRRAGFDLSGLRPHAVNTRHLVSLAQPALLAPAREILTFDLRLDAPAVEHGAIEWMIEEDQPCHGVLCWFVAELGPGVALTNGPGVPGRMQRPQGFLPIEHPVPGRAGDKITLDLRIRPADRLLSWRVRFERDGKLLASFDQSTFKGLLLSASDLPSRAASVTPQEGQTGV